MRPQLHVCVPLLLASACQGLIGNTLGDGASPDSSTELDCSSGSLPATSQMRRLTATQYQNAIRDIFGGAIAPSTQYPAPAGTPLTGFSTELGFNLVSEQDVEQIMDAADDVAVAIAGNINALLPCAAKTAPGDACAQTFVSTYATEAYRRPLTADEQTELMDAFHQGQQAGGTFAESIGFLVDAMMQRPQFVYQVEDAAPTARQLDGYELASRLSFMFTDTIPDAALMAAAADGSLTSPDVLTAQAQRLLASPGADTTLARFFREWTKSKRVSPADKPQTDFPFFDTAFAESMNDSFDQFTVGLLRNGGNLHDLLRSSSYPVDANMAQFYGVSAPAQDWDPAQLDATRYSGIVTQPIVMASLAHTTTSSYVFRGRMIRERILCEPIAPPPPDAQTQFQAIVLPPNATGRETSLAVRNNGVCGSCHNFIDPSGLALESFDGLGQYRATYATGRVISEADQLSAVDDGTLTFSDHIDLLDQLSRSPQVEACFAAQVFRFAMSRTDTNNDACTVSAVQQSYASQGDALDAAFIAFVTTNAFRFKVDP